MLSDSKKQLDITLTEPTLFLRTSDPTGQVEPDPNDSPTLVRGILNLHVVKPIGISSIEVELAGVLTLRPPDERSSRLELPETLRIYSSAVTVFRADQVPRGRRPASVGPGLSTANSSSDDGYAITALPRPPPSPRRRSERRSSVSVPPDLDPTPPYTFVAQPPTPHQSRLGSPVENLGQTLEEHALRGSSEGQIHSNGSAPPSSRPHSIAFSLPNPTNASSNSDVSLLRENDDHTNGRAHTGPPFEDGTSSFNTPEEPPHILPPPSHPSRAHSPGNTHGAQLHTRVNSRDSSITPAGRSRLHISLSSVLDAVMEVTSRAPPRSRSVAEERGRGRTRARIPAEEQSEESNVGEGVTGTGDGSQLGGNSSHPSRHVEHREHHLLGLGRVLGLERGHEEKDGEHKSKEHGGGWRVFKPGTYSYPISFLLPPNLPPTLFVPHGSISYNIKAVAHRPGAFTSKLSCQVPLIVVAAPTTGAGEGGGDPGPLFVQKQWEGKLAYSFGLSSRLFVLGSRHHLETAASAGVRANAEPLVQAEVEARADATYGTVTLDLNILPLDKLKIWRLSVVVDQWIRYIDERGKLFRDDKMHVKLLELEDTCLTEDLDEEETRKNKHRQKHGFTRIPLLPTPISPHRSPLLRHVPSSTDPSILAGPGPYMLSTSIGLPSCNDPSGDGCGLHFTVKQKSSSVKVEHALRIVMRTEWVGDEDTSDHGGDTKKLVDIAVQTPITILSCRCVPEYQTLPRYSEITEDGLQSPAACACQPSVVRRHGREVETHIERAMSSNSTHPFESEDGMRHVHHQADEQRSGRERSRSSSRARRSGQMTRSPLTTTPPHLYLPPESPTSGASELGWRRSAAHAETHSRGQHHHHSRYQSYTASTSHVRTHSETPISTPRESRPPSPLAQYERLVSGLESDAGDAPPSYESISSGV
ncbi:hypothetical protein J3R82DRAFT_8558 [Butyriboletus roseoflavus]|nr:hypothetical protein J3R82DRAFT_8558 [Butyriboletus roseoflavus]